MIPSLRLANPTHYLITLVRSSRGLPPRSAATLEALGLHRMHQSVLQEHSAAAAGKILRVKELVTVKNVTLAEGEQFLQRRRPEGAGVVPSGKLGAAGKV